MFMNCMQYWEPTAARRGICISRTITDNWADGMKAPRVSTVHIHSDTVVSARFPPKLSLVPKSELCQKQPGLNSVSKKCKLNFQFKNEILHLIYWASF